MGSLCETQSSKSGERPYVGGRGCHSDCEEVKPSTFFPARPTTAAFSLTKHHPAPNLFLFWQLLDQDSGEGDGGIQTGTWLILVSPCLLNCIKDLVGQLAMCGSCPFQNLFWSDGQNEDEFAQWGCDGRSTSDLGLVKCIKYINVLYNILILSHEKLFQLAVDFSSLNGLS